MNPHAHSRTLRSYRASLLGSMRQQGGDGRARHSPLLAFVAALRAAESIGRPLGPPAFLDWLAALAGRDPRPGKRGRKPRLAAQAGGQTVRP